MTKDRSKSPDTASPPPVVLTFWKTRPAWILFAISVLVYIQTVSFDYALDDKLYITHNQFTQQGVDGIKDLVSNDLLVGFFGKDKKLLSGGRYRPIPLITFAVEVQLFGNDPSVSHALNLILYGLTCLLLYGLLLRLLPSRPGQHPMLSLPFIATLLFCLHPLHTEVIANIKSRDEMMSLFGALGSLWFVLEYLEKRNGLSMAWAFLCFFGALLSKESTVTFLAAIPFTLIFFRSKVLQKDASDAASQQFSLKEIILAMLPIFVAFGCYMVMRMSLLDDNTGEVTELLNNPFVESSTSDKYATIFYTMGLYIKLLFFPHPLTNDYFPRHIPIIGWGDPRAFLSLILYAWMIWLAVKGFFKRSLISWCIFFFLISFSLFSNLVFPIGSFMNERFMYVPSIGFCVAFGDLLIRGVNRWKSSKQAVERTLAYAVILMSFAFTIKTVHRSRAWKNDFTLAMTDVAISPNSTKANMSAGAALIEKANALPEGDMQRKALANQAIPYLTKALDIYSNYKQPMLLLGSAYFLLDNYEGAYQGYSRALQMDPNFGDAKRNLEFIADRAASQKIYNIAEKCYLTLIANDPNAVHIYAKLGQLYGRDMGNIPKAKEYLEKATQLDPANTDVLQKLGIVYSLTGDNNKALATFLKAYELNPKNANVLMNIGITYRNMGDTEQGDSYLQRAFALDPSLRK